MRNHYDHIPDEEFFFSWVFIPFLNEIDQVSEFSTIDIRHEIFQKAIQLGYNRKEATQKIYEMQERYTNQNNFPIRLNTRQNNFCRDAFFLILKEIIAKDTPHSKILKMLDTIFAYYDPMIPENYMNPKPSDIILPKNDAENWLDFSLELPEKIQAENEFFTLYSSINTKYVHFGEELMDDEEITTSFISSSNALLVKNGIPYLDIDDLIRYPVTKTMSDFKKLDNLQDQGTPFEQMIYLSDNIWNLHSNNKLVRLWNNFILENGLRWKDDTSLDLYDNSEKIVRYEFWGAPYNGDPDYRERISSGVRLQIKTSFLIDYMKKTKKSLIYIMEKSRKKVKPALNRENKKILGEKENKKVIVFNPDD